MKKLLLTISFVSVLLVTGPRQAATTKCLDDWVDEICEKGDSEGCLKKCKEKHRGKVEGYCAYSNCFCEYKCCDYPGDYDCDDSSDSPPDWAKHD